MLLVLIHVLQLLSCERVEFGFLAVKKKMRILPLPLSVVACCIISLNVLLLQMMIPGDT